jgi:hypothetical protein
MRTSACGTGDIHLGDSVLGQGISMEFGFIVQRSTCIERYESFHGINGETTYLIIADHYADILWGMNMAG